MQWLRHSLTTTSGFMLPLSDQAAARLAVALLTDEPASAVQRLREVLADEAPLVLWAVCRARQRGAPEIGTLAQLADWLLPVALDALGDAALTPAATPAVCAATAEKWADLAAVSRAIAGLSSQIARHAAVDPERAYFLGLLHAAPQWLAAAPFHGEPPECSALLPQDLQSTTAAVPATEPISSAAECVAMALRMAEVSAVADEPCLPGFRFDRPAHAAQIAAARHVWLQPSHPDLLPALVGQLARLKNLEERFDETLEKEKLDSLKELAYGAGHEINNPLANISARAQTLLHGERDPDRRRMLAAINTQAFRAHEMIADMMLFARPPQPRFEPVDLGALAGTLVEELAPQASEQHSQLVLLAPQRPVTIQADKTQIAVAVRALCVNALETLVTGGRVEIQVAESAPLDENVQITVSDNGPGIPSEARRHIFDPFYSGREAGRGLGFGLSKCWRIVTMHGGSLEVDSSPGCGARFTILLPARRIC
jgi:signal transduction histidine kinase